MKKRFILLLLAIILVSSLAIGQVYDRKETLYAGGGLWSPPNNWNPFTPWAIMTGTNGLIYEYLFMFDPLSNEMIPWLAVDGGWIDGKTYELKLRDGVYWTDGEEFNAEDVKFTFDIAKKYPGVHYSSMWNWMKEVEILDRLTVRVHFTEPLYQQWSFQLYQLPMVPEHIWKNKTEAEIL
ncbi:ABC transporter substrate-binding protein, partial [Mesotoga sp.]